MKRITPLLIAVALAAGCSDDGATTSTPATSTPATSTPGTSTPATSTEVPDTPAPTPVPSTTPATTSEPGPLVSVFFATSDGTDCGDVAEFVRSASGNADLVTAAFEHLVAGPTPAEVAAGAGSFFGPDTAGAVRNTELTGGLLIVDLWDVRDALPNASTSCGSESLLAQLNATAFQFDAVDRVRYEFEGSCADFAGFLQGECTEFTREGEGIDAIGTASLASGSGCTPGSATLPDGRWFGYVPSTTEAGLDFDLACWFSGRAAVVASAEDGEESPPPNDYYIRNTSSSLREVPVAAGATVVWYPTGDPADELRSHYSEWITGRETRVYQLGVWIDVAGGEIVSIDEQWVP